MLSAEDEQLLKTSVNLNLSPLFFFSLPCSFYLAFSLNIFKIFLSIKLRLEFFFFFYADIALCSPVSSAAV